MSKLMSKLSAKFFCFFKVNYSFKILLFKNKILLFEKVLSHFIYFLQACD